MGIVSEEAIDEFQELIDQGLTFSFSSSTSFGFHCDF